MSIQFSLLLSSGRMAHITMGEEFEIIDQDERHLKYEELPLIDRFNISDAGMDLASRVIDDRKSAGIAGDREAV